MEILDTLAGALEFIAKLIFYGFGILVVLLVLLALAFLVFAKCWSAWDWIKKAYRQQALWKFWVSLLFRINARLGLAYAQRHRHRTEKLNEKRKEQRKFMGQKTKEVIYKRQMRP